MAAKQGEEINLRPDMGYDRRRAIRIVPTDGATTIEVETCKNLVNALKAAVETNAITVIRMINEAEFQAVLVTPMQVEELCKKAPLMIANQKLDISPYVPRSRKIWIYNPSIFIKIHSIRAELGKHCQVAHIEDIPNEYGASTGKLFGYVEGENIPSAIFVGSVRINVTYRGMERKCRLCQSTEHAAGSCLDRTCFNCSKKGHVSLECTEGCKTCGATSHTTRNCRENFPDLGSMNQFPELKTRTPKDGKEDNPRAHSMETLEQTNASDKVPETPDAHPMTGTTDRTAIEDDTPAPPGALTTEETILAAPDMEGLEKICIDDIIQEVAAALPVCSEQMMEDAAVTKEKQRTESETTSTESDRQTDHEIANKRKRKEKKRGTTRAHAKTSTNKKTKASNLDSTRNTATSDPGPTRTTNPQH